MTTTTSGAPRRSRLRLSLPLAGAALLGLVATLLSPMAANAAVALSGVVVGPTGTALSGVSIQVIDVSTETVVASKTSATNGSFSVLGLAPDDYTLKFAGTSTTYPQYLGGSAVLENAQLLELDGGAGDKSYIKAALSASGTIGGTVKTASGTAISSATVTVYQAKDAKWIVVKTATTSSTGTYSIKGLQPGAYRVQAKKGTAYAPVFSGGAASILAAKDVGVLAAKTTTTSFKLGAPAKVSGVVRADVGSGGVPLAGVKVTAWRFVGSASFTTPVELVSSTATTSASGAYTLTGLTPGDYTLYFEAPASSGVGSGFLGHETQPKYATSFIVPSGASVTGKNFTLGNAGTISGSLHREGVSGPAIPNVRVSLYGNGEDADDPLVKPRAVVFTQSDGSYQFTHVGQGFYTIVFGAFEKSTLTEDVDWERRSLGAISVSAGGNATGNDRETIPRVLPYPEVGQEPSITLSGVIPAQIGTSASINTGTWNTSAYPQTGGYRWYRDGVLVPDVDSFQYSFHPGDLGHTFTAEMWRFDWARGYATHRTDATPVVTLGDAPTLTGSFPSIVGSPRVGQTLSVDPGQWEVTDNSGELFGLDLGILWDYTWQRSPDGSTWTDIETAPTHVVTASDVTDGPYLRVHMHGERYGYADVEYDIVAPASAMEGEFTQIKAAGITTTTTTWKANPGTWSPTPDAPQYTWHVYDAANNLEATHTTQSLSRTGLSGKRITLTIALDADQVELEAVHFLVQKGKAPTATGSLLITGTPRVGEVLTAPTLTWTLIPDSITYKWQYLSGTTWKTVGGNTSTFTPTAGLIDKRIRVQQTAITDGYVNGAKTSSQTAAVLIGLAPTTPVTAPSFITSPAVNVVAQVDPGVWVPAATSIAYTWKSSANDTGPWTTISGATSATYKPGPSLLGKWLQVTITAKRTGHTTATQIIAPQKVLVGVLVNTVKPTLSHDSAPLPTYTVTTPGTWSPPGDSYGYLWKVIDVDGSDIDYGSTPDFDTSASGAYSPVDVVVSAFKTGWADGSIRIPVKDGVFQFNSTTDVTQGTAQVGSELNGVAPVLYNAPLSAVLTPQWQYKNTATTWASIPNATSLDYTPTVTYLGKEIRLRVRITNARYETFDDFGPARVVTSGVTPVEGSGADAPSFSGSPAMLAKLTVNPGVWNVPGLAFTYQWQIRPQPADPWTNLTGATTASYTPPEARYGQELRVVITAKKAGYPTGTAFVDAGAIGMGQLTVVTKPVVSKSGSTLTTSNGTWNTTGVSFSYAWIRMYSNGTNVVVGTNKSYTLTADDIGHYVFVDVNANKPLFQLGIASVVGQLGPKLEPTSTITMGGDNIVGQIIYPTTPSWNSALVSPAYQWLRNGVAIPGATGAGYQVVAADIGKTVAVRVSAAVTGYPSYSTIVSAGIAAAAAAPVNTVAPVASVTGGGSPQVGKTVSTTSGTWSVAGMSYAYQWYRGVNKIPGATSSTYLLVAADLGYEISARVTASKAGYISVTAKTATSTVLLGVAPTGSTPTISVVGGTSLKASTVSWSLPVTVSYQWQTRPTDADPWEDIVGGTADTLPTSSILSGWKTRVVVTGSRPGHADGVSSSTSFVIP